MKLAKTRARMKIFQAMPEPLVLQTDTLESTKVRMVGSFYLPWLFLIETLLQVDLHNRTTRLLEATQALMRETKALAVEVSVCFSRMTVIKMWLQATKRGTRGSLTDV
jgi:hypothetical protein